MDQFEPPKKNINECMRKEDRKGEDIECEKDNMEGYECRRMGLESEGNMCECVSEGEN